MLFENNLIWFWDAPTVKTSCYDYESAFLCPCDLAERIHGILEAQKFGDLVGGWTNLFEKY